MNLHGYEVFLKFLQHFLTIVCVGASESAKIVQPSIVCNFYCVISEKKGEKAPVGISLFDFRDCLSEMYCIKHICSASNFMFFLNFYLVIVDIVYDKQ